MGWIREWWKNDDMYSLSIFTTRVKLNCLSNWCISLLICPWFRYSDSKHNFWITRLWYTVTLVTVLMYSHSVLRTFLQHRIPSTDTWLVSHILQKLTMRQLVEFFSFLCSIPIGPLLFWDENPTNPAHAYWALLIPLKERHVFEQCQRFRTSKN